MLLPTLLLLSAGACAKVDPAYAAQYVTYERHGRARPDYGSESDERVWFRFHNNTTCRLTIPAATPFRLRTLPDGRMTIDPVDGQEVALDVSISSPESGDMWLHPGGCMRSETALPAGQSVVFSVAANFLKRGPIAIDFSYDWETSGVSYGKIQHRLLFDVKVDVRYEPDLLTWLEHVTDPPPQPYLSAEHPGRRLSGEPASPAP